MEQVEKQMIEHKTVYEQIVHKFYCDNCNKFIAESVEDEDGYYYRYGKVEIPVLIQNKWGLFNEANKDRKYKYSACLCGECTDKQIKLIIEEITKLGFKKDYC